jgi:rubredoxin
MSNARTDREAFEKWATSGGYAIGKYGSGRAYPEGDYYDPRTHNAWLGWQARGQAETRRLLDSDAFCPSCGHNRDKSSVSSIDNEDGTKSCQVCAATWIEREITTPTPREK